jgi:hypothetical protein
MDIGADAPTWLPIGPEQGLHYHWAGSNGAHPGGGNQVVIFSYAPPGCDVTRVAVTLTDAEQHALEAASRAGNGMGITHVSAKAWGRYRAERLASGRWSGYQTMWNAMAGKDAS